MIYKLEWTDGRIDWFTAESQLHLLKSYDAQFDLVLSEIEDLKEISLEEAKEIVIKNTEYDATDKDDYQTQPLSDFASDEFSLVASNYLE